MSTTDLLVRKDQLATTHLRTSDDASLADGQVRVRVDSFALTANNITYAAFGDSMNYWQYYPVDGSAGSGWGRIPVWGFGSVVQSLQPGIAVGERLYGYFPMASSVVLQPVRLAAKGFIDGAPHRAALHALYNQYQRCNVDPFYSADSEDMQALLRPLYLTSWLIDDFLADNDWFGAGPPGDVRGVMLLSSASSKTAYGTAYHLAQRQGIEVVGLTSAAHVDFCNSLGLYHRVLRYDQLDQVAADAPCVYVDFAGNAALRRVIHTRFVNLKYSCSIGGTHVDQLGGAHDLPGPRPTLFFAPAQGKKRTADWGGSEFGKRLVQAWHAFAKRVVSTTPPWITVQHHYGPRAVQEAYAQVLGGCGDARVGHILSLAKR
jgi:hypothetical protein